MYSGDLIKAHREKKGYTQRELAEKVGTTNPMITRWENNKAFPGNTLALLIAEEMGPAEIVPKTGTFIQSSFSESSSGL